MGEFRVDKIGMIESRLTTVIVGTNRPNSMSELVAKQFLREFEMVGGNGQLLALRDLPREFAFADMYGERSEKMNEIINTFIIPADRLIFVIPEYNGGFPGVLKTFVDAVPQATWKDKSAGLIGVSSGPTGAARAMDQFTSVLHYLRVHVHYLKPKLSNISMTFQGDSIAEERAKSSVKDFALAMLKF